MLTYVFEREALYYPCTVGVMRRAMHRWAEHRGEKRPRDPDALQGGPERDGWEEVESACAENAASVAIHRPWPGDWWTRKKTVDIPPDIEVRWTRYSDGHLFLYPADSSELRYVLVTGKLPCYVVHGWKWGYEAKQMKYWGKFRPERPPCFMVPQNELHALSDLEAK